MRRGTSKCRIQKPCEGERIEGTIKFNRIWVIPKEDEKPLLMKD